jgi:sugar phosphate isomerase/epimerase
MKLSIVISTQPASFSALAYKGQWQEHVRKIAELGYDGVELAVRDPRLLDAGEVKSLTGRLGLAVPALGTGQAYGEEGLSFTHPERDVRRRAVERVKTHIELAHVLGAVVIIGLIRGRRGPGAAPGESERWLIEALRECAGCDQAVRLAIEPINRYETDLVNTVASGLGLLEKVGMGNVGLLLDTFHMNIEEPSLTASIVAGKDRLFHFHIADSNRWYPGAGHTRFAPVVDTLKQVGYRGFLSAEILPLPDPDEAAKKTIENMRRFEV